MTGIPGLNSLILGLQGVQVQLVLPGLDCADFVRAVWARHAPQAELKVTSCCESRRLPFEDDTFDMVWNFNVMTHQPDPEGVLSELVRLSRKYVLMFVPNHLNYSFWLHRLHHAVARQEWDHGHVDLMHPRPWQRMLTGLGLRVQETLWVDCPWWPDIVDLGQMIGDFVPPLKRFASRAKPENRYRWEAGQLPYYRPQEYAEVHAQMTRLAFFEDSRQVWLKQRFAHHVGVLAVKE